MAEGKYLIDHAQLMDEWDWERNVDVRPEQVTLGSNKKVWWKGNCGHSWEAPVKGRNAGRGCPVCAGKIV